MSYIILILAVLMLVRNAIAVRHYPSTPNILLLLFWMAAFAYALVPSQAIFVVSTLLVVLALASRVFPQRAQAIGERLGLPEVGDPPNKQSPSEE
jgi:hypothetical protein